VKVRIAALAISLSLSSSACALDCEAITFANIPYSVCRANITDGPKLFLHDDKGKPFKSFSSLKNWLSKRGQKLVFAMNAGMYHRDLTPVGLFVAESQKTWPLNTSGGKGNFYLQPNGVFAITASGASVVTVDRFTSSDENVALATQSGPMLVIEGKLHAAFNSSSTSRFIRNGVCAPTPQEMVFVISEAPVNFYQFALLFRDHFGCQDALYFDGVVSSLYSSQLHRHDRHAPLGPIIAIVE
jgi:uncharacterized protein YigE (DUF2233 family)